MFCAVIFDWDGTLADSKDAIVASFQKVFREARITVSDEFIQRRIGIGSRNLIIEALKASNTPLDDGTINMLERKKVEAEIKLSSMVKLFGGAVELLDSLSGRTRTALATMNNRAVIERLLDEKGLRNCFDAVVAAEDIAKAKPHPEIFLEAAARLQCPPKECVVLEDSVFGVKAAKTAGMRCIAIRSGVYSETELRQEKPDLIADSLKEERILNFLLG
jgi:HAD superfamily hydrolase (TIGR01509 family)